MFLCYFNNRDNEKYRELFDTLSKNEENKTILFDVMLKYKLFFKKQIDISKDLLNEIIKYATKKDFITFKEDALFYLKDINAFPETMDNNKDDIINMEGFDPIEIPEIKDGKEIKFGIINPKIKSITNFSKDKKKILIILKGKFWENLAKKCSEISKVNIEICSTIRLLFNQYNNMISDILSKESKIRQDINSSFKRGIFTHQIDSIIKKYIKTNSKITNKEIIDLIKNYDKYY